MIEMSPLAYERFGRPLVIAGRTLDSEALPDWVVDILFGCFDQPTARMRARVDALEHAAVAYFVATVHDVCG
jgi:hypothetical protein